MGKEGFFRIKKRNIFSLAESNKVCGSLVVNISRYKNNNGGCSTGEVKRGGRVRVEEGYSLVMFLIPT